MRKLIIAAMLIFIALNGIMGCVHYDPLTDDLSETNTIASTPQVLRTPTILSDATSSPPSPKDTQVELSQTILVASNTVSPAANDFRTPPASYEDNGLPVITDVIRPTAGEKSIFIGFFYPVVPSNFNPYKAISLYSEARVPLFFDLTEPNVVKFGELNPHSTDVYFQMAFTCLDNRSYPLDLKLKMDKGEFISHIEIDSFSQAWQDDVAYVKSIAPTNIPSITTTYNIRLSDGYINDIISKQVSPAVSIELKTDTHILKILSIEPMAKKGDAKPATDNMGGTLITYTIDSLSQDDRTLADFVELPNAAFDDALFSFKWSTESMALYHADELPPKDNRYKAYVNDATFTASDTRFISGNKKLLFFNQTISDQHIYINSSPITFIISDRTGAYKLIINFEISQDTSPSITLE